MNGATLNLLRKSNSLGNLLDQNEYSNQVSSNDSTAQPGQRFSLIEKKRLKWEQDKVDDYNPFGKPGCGAGPIKQPVQRQMEVQVTHQPLPVQHNNLNQNTKTQKYQESLEEYKRINDTLAQIVAAENKIKQEQIELLKMQVAQQQQQQQPNQNIINNDQSKVPAAMRTSVMFGNFNNEDEIKKTKELERKKWLQDLEAQKKEQQLEVQRKKLDLSINNYDINQTADNLRQSLGAKTTNLINNNVFFTFRQIKTSF
jgi:hypothetical protein